MSRKSYLNHSVETLPWREGERGLLLVRTTGISDGGRKNIELPKMSLVVLFSNPTVPRPGTFGGKDTGKLLSLVMLCGLHRMRAAPLGVVWRP